MSRSRPPSVSGASTASSAIDTARYIRQLRFYIGRYDGDIAHYTGDDKDKYIRDTLGKISHALEAIDFFEYMSGFLKSQHLDLKLDSLPKPLSPRPLEFGVYNSRTDTISIPISKEGDDYQFDIRDFEVAYTLAHEVTHAFDSYIHRATSARELHPDARRIYEQKKDFSSFRLALHTDGRPGDFEEIDRELAAATNIGDIKAYRRKAVTELIPRLVEHHFKRSTEAEGAFNILTGLQLGLTSEKSQAFAIPLLRDFRDFCVSSAPNPAIRIIPGIIEEAMERIIRSRPERFDRDGNFLPPEAREADAVISGDIDKLTEDLFGEERSKVSRATHSRLAKMLDSRDVSTESPHTR